MRLYKYVPPERVDILKNAMIRFTQPSALNDIFEMQPVIEHLGTVDAVRELAAKYWDRTIDETIEEGYYRRTPEERGGLNLDEAKSRARALAGDVGQQVHEMVESKKVEVGARMLAWLDATVGVLSLTDRPDNLLMWAHYARRHEGFLVEFDSDHGFFHSPCGRNDEFGRLMRVEYGERPSTVMIEATVGELFFTKGRYWSYESEWRMVLPVDRAAKRLPSEAGTVNLFALNPACISGVVLGCRMNDPDGAAVRRALNANDALRNVRRLKAVPEERDYGVNIVDADEG